MSYYGEEGDALEKLGPQFLTGQKLAMSAAQNNGNPRKEKKLISRHQDEKVQT